MYLPSNRIRTRSRVERFEPEFKARPERTSPGPSPSSGNKDVENPEGEIRESSSENNISHPSALRNNQEASLQEEWGNVGLDPWRFPVSQSDDEVSPVKQRAPTKIETRIGLQAGEKYNQIIQEVDKDLNSCGSKRNKADKKQDVALDRCEY